MLEALWAERGWAAELNEPGDIWRLTLPETLTAYVHTRHEEQFLVYVDVPVVWRSEEQILEAVTRLDAATYLGNFEMLPAHQEVRFRCSFNFRDQVLSRAVVEPVMEHALDVVVRASRAFALLDDLDRAVERFEAERRAVQPTDVTEAVDSFFSRGDLAPRRLNPSTLRFFCAGEHHDGYHGYAFHKAEEEALAFIVNLPFSLEPAAVEAAKRWCAKKNRQLALGCLTYDAVNGGLKFRHGVSVRHGIDALGIRNAMFPTVKAADRLLGELLGGALEQR